MPSEAAPGEQEDNERERDPDTVQSAAVQSSCDASTSRSRLLKLRIREFHRNAEDYLEWKRQVMAIRELYRALDDQLGGLVYLRQRGQESRGIF